MDATGLTGRGRGSSIRGSSVMKVHLAYGRGGLEVDVPDSAHVLLPERLPALPDPAAVIRQALRRPIASPPLRERARPGARVSIVFSDITRPTPNRVILPPLLAELEEAGIAREDITLINALGMHRPNTPQELAEMLGPEIIRDYRVVQHDAHDPSQLAYLRTNERGARVEVNTRYLSADVRILTGFVEPHIFAGYSGGGKAVLPGVAGAETVMSNHSGPMVTPEGALVQRGGQPHLPGDARSGAGHAAGDAAERDAEREEGDHGGVRGGARRGP